MLPVRALEIAGYVECPHQDMLMKDGVDAARVWNCVAMALKERGIRWDAITATAVHFHRRTFAANSGGIRS